MDATVRVTFIRDVTKKWNARLLVRGIPTDLFTSAESMKQGVIAPRVNFIYPPPPNISLDIPVYITIVPMKSPRPNLDSKLVIGGLLPYLERHYGPINVETANGHELAVRVKICPQKQPTIEAA